MSRLIIRRDDCYEYAAIASEVQTSFGVVRSWRGRRSPHAFVHACSRPLHAGLRMLVYTPRIRYPPSFSSLTGWSRNFNGGVLLLLSSRTNLIHPRRSLAKQASMHADHPTHFSLFDKRQNRSIRLHTRTDRFLGTTMHEVMSL